MDLSISSKRNVSAFQATFFEMLSAWSASFLAGMTCISREMNHRACKERRRRLLPMRLRLEPSVNEQFGLGCSLCFVATNDRTPESFTKRRTVAFDQNKSESQFCNVSFGCLHVPAPCAWSL